MAGCSLVLCCCALFNESHTLQCIACCCCYCCCWCGTDAHGFGTDLAIASNHADEAGWNIVKKSSGCCSATDCLIVTMLSHHADEADWNIVKKGWEAHVLGEAPHYFKDALTAVKTLRVSGHEVCCRLAG